MGSLLGVQKVAATRVGLPLSEYEARRGAGLKWCIACQHWKPLEAFGIDVSRGDGHYPRCFDCRHAKRRVFLGVKDEYAKQRAHDAVRTAIRRGLLRPATECVCLCGQPARQYHHDEGYEPDFYLYVVALCISCHRRAHWGPS